MAKLLLGSVRDVKAAALPEDVHAGKEDNQKRFNLTFAMSNLLHAPVYADAVRNQYKNNARLLE
jgi:hypothetical protein